MSDSPSRERRLEEVIHGYLQAVDAGQAPNQDEVVRQHPELADDLRAFFADQRRMDDMARSIVRSPAGEVPTLPHGEPANSAQTVTVRYFGDYELLDEIARGGMGVVFRARQKSLNRIVALKMILKGELAGEADVQRFRKEAEAAANLDHPNIVPIYEVGEHDGQQYFSMKLVEGTSLAKKVGELDADPRAGARLLAAVARAVDYAHQRGIVHRDLKPANILLDNQGQPHVTDFGLAKQIDSADGPTQTGAILGTPSYMAPEQAAGRVRQIGVAADIYALGAILYELLTGRPPFRGDTPLEVLLQVMNDDPVTPRLLQPKAPGDLETICLKCLEKTPKKRYATAAVLADDLERWLHGEPILARPVGWLERIGKWAKRRPAVAGLLSVCLLACVTLLAGWGSFTVKLKEQRDFAREAERQKEIERDNAEQARGETAEALGKEEAARRQTDEALEDTRRVLSNSRMFQAHAAWQENDIPRARAILDEVPAKLRFWEWNYLRRLSDGGQFTLRGHVGAVNSVAFSPDGQQLASGGSDGTVKVWDFRTGTLLRTLTGHTGQVRCVAFSPDGQHLASGSWDGFVKLWNTRTGQEVWTLRKTPAGLFSAIYSLAFSPDGRRLVLGTNGDPPAVEVRDSGTGKEIFSYKIKSGFVLGVAYSPDGQRLAAAFLLFGRESDSVKVWEARTFKEVDGFHGFNKGAIGPAATVAFSPNGQWLAARGSGTLKIWACRTGSEIFTTRGKFVPMGLAGEINFLAFSPDGERLATAGSRNNGVFILDVQTTYEIGHYNADCDYVNAVAFSPDGRWLAAADDRGAIHAWDLRNDTDSLVLARSVSASAFSPDGVHLAGVDGNKIALFDARTGIKVRTFSAGGNAFTTVAFSPDGEQLAAGQHEGAANAPGCLVVWEVQTGRLVFTRKGYGTKVAYRPDGKMVAVGSWDGTVKLVEALKGKEVNTIKGEQRNLHHIAFSPNGQILATAHGEWNGTDGYVVLWDAFTGGKLHTIKGHSKRVNSIAFSADSRWLASASDDRVVKIWDVSSRRELQALVAHARVEHIAFSTDGQRLVSKGPESTGIVIWDARTGQEIFRIAAVQSVEGNLVFSPDGERLAAGLRIWDARRVREPVVLKGHRMNVGELTFSPSSQSMASIDVGSTIKVWNVRTGQVIHNFEGKSWDEKCSGSGKLVFSPDGERLVALNPNALGLWDLHTGTRILKYLRTNRGGMLMKPTMSEDGKLLAASFQDGEFVDGAFRVNTPPQIIVWNCRTGQEVCAIKPPEKTWVHTVAFSRDGRHLAVADLVGTVSVWNAQTAGKTVDFKAGKKGDLLDLSFSPDGGRVIVWNGETQRVWDVQTGRLLPDAADRATFRFPDRVLGYDPLSPDGRFLAARDRDIIRVYDLNTDTEELKYRKALTQPDPNWHDWQARAFSVGTGGLGDPWVPPRWPAVGFHCNLAIASWPHDSSLYLRRGNAHAELGQWQKAIADFAKAFELTPDSSLAGRRLALAQLAAGNVVDYQRVCRQLLDRFARTESANEANLVARTCTLRPDAVSEPDKLLALVPKLDDDNAYHLHTRGYILFRAGRSDEALKYLDKPMDQNRGVSTWLYLALTEQALGHADKAKKALEQAGTHTGGSWEERVEAEPLRKEIEMKLTTKSE